MEKKFGSVSALQQVKTSPYGVIRKMKYFLLVLLFLSACATKPVPLPAGPRTLLFPFGTYQHLVQLKLAKAPPKGPQSFDFRGVFVFQKERMKLVALTPFGTTLFRAEEDFKTGEIINRKK